MPTAAQRLVEFETGLREGTGLLPERTLVSWSSARAQKVGELGDRVPMTELGAATVAGSLPTVPPASTQPAPGAMDLGLQPPVNRPLGSGVNQPMF